MANVFCKFGLNFYLEDAPGNDALKTKYQSNGAYELNVTVRSKSENDVNLAFKLSSENLEDGVFEHNLEGEKLSVKCEGIFKLSVKSGYEDDVLDKDALWTYDNIGSYDQGLTFLKVASGLEIETFETMRRGQMVEATRHPLNVSTAAKKSDL